MATTKKTSKKEYGESSIKTLEGTDAIRKRPGMYIGSIGEEGVLRLFYEALGNAIDEFQAGRASNILVKIDERNSEIQISDNGIGLPQTMIEECCTKLHSSGKFEDEYSMYSIGQNGVGLTVINALSENLIMLVKRDGYHWKQTFSKGKVTSKLTKGDSLKKGDSTGTTISFIPDISVFNEITVNVERYLSFIELSAYMNKGLTFDFVGIKSDGKKITKKIISKEGLLDYVKVFDKKLLLKNPIVIEGKSEYDEVIKKKTPKGIQEVKTGKKVHMECEIIIQYSKNDTNTIKSFCNGLETIEGGSHVTGFSMAMTEVLTKATMNSSVMTKKDKVEIIKDDVNEGLIALVNVRHSNALFKSQTKDKLDMSEVQWWIKKTAVDGLNKWLNSNSAQSKIIFERIFIAAKARLAANRAKTAKKKEAGGLINGLSSLSKLTLASGGPEIKKRMFIVEGDSAGGGAVLGRCTVTDSIMKLRGKPLNTYGLSTTKVEANKEFSDIVTALGCGIDNTFDVNKLTHDQIIACTDSDVDGHHIAVLLATFFFSHMPDIIKDGHFYIASAPLYRVDEGSKSLYFNNEEEYNGYVTDRILEKYKVGRISKKDGKTVLKSFKRTDFIKFLKDTEMYKTKILNIKNDNAINSMLIEFIINNHDSKKLSEKIEKTFSELKCTKLKKDIHVEGMIGYDYQDFIINNKFYEEIQSVIDIIEDNNYKNLFIKKGNDKSRKAFIGEILDEVLSYGTPKHRTRFKGLGEMDYDELWHTTMRPEAGGIVQIKANSMEELQQVLDVQVGNDPNKRKLFLEKFEIRPEDIDN